MIKYNNATINDWNFEDDNITKVYYNEAVVYKKISGGTPPTPHDYSKDYLTFVATESGTFKFSGASTSNKVSYSIDSGATWSTIARVATTPTVTAGNKVMWKASGLLPNSSNGIGRFSSTANFTAEGNIMSLHFGDNFSGETSLSSKSNAYRTLFSGCTTLTSVENLCLAATTLSSGSYNRMFMGCTNLTTAPKELPATTLGTLCYSNMFSGCTSLTTIPSVLPATTLQSQCYYSMFQKTKVGIVPSGLLPATTLASGCYTHMFRDCSSLTKAPDLPAPTLVDSCYQNMFYNSPSLQYIKCLATDISASNCTSSWVSSGLSNGIFVKASSMNDWTTGTSGIPSGWTVQNA